MKTPALIRHALTGLAFACAVTSTALAEEAKIPFAKGVKPEVQIARPSRVKGGDFDDKTVVVTPKIKLTNTTTQQAYMGYKAVYYLIFESAAQRGIYKVVQKHDFDITLPPRQVMESEGAAVTSQYDTTGAAFGYKYDGWVLQVTDPKGEIILTKSTSPTLEKKAAELTKILQVEQCYDRQWKPCPEPRF
jgi:hypothetical protein